MPPSIIAVSPSEPREDRLQQAAAVLKAGGIAALPTETFYGLAADVFHVEALKRLNRLKKKADDSPILLLLADVTQLALVADAVPLAAEELAGRFWPGPLTMVVPASKDLPREVSGGRGTVGVRVPGMELPRRLAAVLERPITGVSANLHRDPPARTAEDVVRIFDDQIDLVLDGGEAPGGAPSTILDLTVARPCLLRAGAVPLSALRPFLSGL